MAHVMSRRINELLQRFVDELCSGIGSSRFRLEVPTLLFLHRRQHRIVLQGHPASLPTAPLRSDRTSRFAFLSYGRGLTRWVLAIELEVQQRCHDYIFISEPSPLYVIFPTASGSSHSVIGLITSSCFATPRAQCEPLPTSTLSPHQMAGMRRCHWDAGVFLGSYYCLWPESDATLDGPLVATSARLSSPFAQRDEARRGDSRPPCQLTTPSCETVASPPRRPTSSLCIPARLSPKYLS